MSMYAIVLTFFIAMILMKIFLVVWTFQDAKNSRLNQWLWVTVVVFTPTYIGVLIYFLLGHRYRKIECSKCKTIIEAKSKHCPECGESLTGVEINHKRKSSKWILIACSICLIAIISTCTLFVINIFDEKNIIEQKNLNIAFETSLEDKFWDVSYFTSDNEYVNNIEFNKSDTKKLYVRSESWKGSLYLDLEQDNTKKTINITNEPKYMNIDLSSFENGEIKLRLRSKDALYVKFTSKYE